MTRVDMHVSLLSLPYAGELPATAQAASTRVWQLKDKSRALLQLNSCSLTWRTPNNMYR